MRIAVCDDEVLCLEDLRLRLSNYLGERTIPYEIVPMSTPKPLLEGPSEKFDAIFLDVEIGDWNGIDVAERVRQYDSQVPVVYISGHIEYSPSGYLVNAFRYLLKNDLDSTFDECMEALLNHFNSIPESITITFGVDSHEVKLEDIVYIESEKRILVFHANNAEIYRCYAAITSMEERLHAKGFLRIQKSYLVNMAYVWQIKNYQVVLRGGTTLQATRHNFRKLQQAYMLFKGKL